MNLSPISNFSYKALNFKGNTSNPIENKNKNLQNNSPEVYISPETYFSMLTNKVFDDMNKNGITSKIEKSVSNDSDFFDFTSPDFNAADVAIYNLKNTALMVSSSIDSKTDVPVFMKLDYKNYLTTLEKQIAAAEQQLETMDLSYFDEGTEYDDELGILDGISESDDELDDFDDLSDFSDAISLKSALKETLSALPQIIESQKDLLKAFKTTKAQKLKEALEECSNAHNALLYSAILHGFQRNARSVIADLTNNIEMYNTPEITENDDGTTTYKYYVFTNIYTITKNSENGDYINASSKGLDGRTNFMIDFNLDGSIKKLDYVNNVDQSIVTVSQKDNRVSVKQTSNGVVSQRTFIKTPDEKLKQTSMNISVYQ